MRITIASTTGALLILVIAMLVYSIARPSKRMWPPPAQQTWQYYFVWLLTLFSYGGFIAVGLLDWNSLGWPSIVRWPVGLALIISSHGLESGS